MKNCLKTIIILSTIIYLFTGCASHNIHKVKELPKNEDKFSQALSDAYLEFALFELNEMHDDWDAHVFAKKSLAAKKGELVFPEEISNWKIDNSIKKEANNKRKEIILMLNNKKTKQFPELIARSQLGFDCWLEQLEEGWQEDHIKQCYDMMNNSLIDLQSRISILSDNKSQNKKVSFNEDINNITPAKIIVNNQSEKNKIFMQKIKIYFNHNNYTLNIKALNNLEKATDKIEKGYTRIVIEGHADRSGTEKYNLNLSKLRAETVKDFLIKKGISEGTIVTKFFGESKPLYHTRDGIKEPKNRRVQIEIHYDQNILSRL